MTPTHAVERTVEANETLGPAVIESYVFRKEAHTATRGGVPETPSEQTSSAAGRSHKTHCKMNCRAFACAVWPEKAENLSYLHCQIKIFEGVQTTLTQEGGILFANILELESRRHPVYSKWRARSTLD